MIVASFSLVIADRGQWSIHFHVQIEVRNIALAKSGENLGLFLAAHYSLSMVENRFIVVIIFHQLVIDRTLSSWV